MDSIRTVLLLVALAGFTLSGPASAVRVYKCVDASAKVTYSDIACETANGGARRTPEPAGQVKRSDNADKGACREGVSLKGTHRGDACPPQSKSSRPR